MRWCRHLLSLSVAVRPASSRRQISEKPADRQVCSKGPTPRTPRSHRPMGFAVNPATQRPRQAVFPRRGGTYAAPPDTQSSPAVGTAVHHPTGRRQIRPAHSTAPSIWAMICIPDNRSANSSNNSPTRISFSLRSRYDFLRSYLVGCRRILQAIVFTRLPDFRVARQCKYLYCVDLDEHRG